MMNMNAKDVEEYLKGVPDWQRANLVQFRKLVHKVEPKVQEEIKWGVPVFLVNGKMVLAMSSFKEHSKYNFITNGAFLDDKKRLFNNGLQSKKSRSIDRREGDKIDETALEDLVKQAFVKLENK